MAFAHIKEFVRRARYVFSREFIRSITEVVNGSNITSDTMLEAVDLWLEMFGGS